MRAEKAHTLNEYVHIFIYFCGITIKVGDKQELCGVDSQGNIFQIEKYLRAFSQYANTFVVAVVDGVEDPEPESINLFRRISFDYNMVDDDNIKKISKNMQG